MKLTILIVRFLEELNGIAYGVAYFGGLCYLTIRVLSLLYQITPHCHVDLKSY